MENNSFLLDFDSLVLDKEAIPNEETLNQFLVLRRNNERLYININDMLATVMMHDSDYNTFIIDTLRDWNTLENYEYVQQRLRNDTEYNTNPELNNLINFFSTDIYDTV